MTPPLTAADETKRAELLGLLVARRSEFLAFLRRRLPSDADSEDLLQQGLLLATDRLGQLRDPRLVVPWFYRTLRRLLADHHLEGTLREARRGPAIDLPAPERALTCSCSLKVMATLPAQYAEVLRRVDIGDEDLAEVAEALGTTVNNATVRLHRARKALREQLRESCGTISAKACLDCAC
jgi:DNA-directed RNA polymerase specialized sigma24 family protein